MDAKLIRSMTDALIERGTGKTRTFDRFDYLVGDLGPFTCRVFHDEFPAAPARVLEAERQMREHALALSNLPR